MKIKMYQAQEGKSYRHRLRKDGSAEIYTVCCDCGLVHREKYTPISGAIAIRVWREDELTAGVRAKRKGKK